MPNSAGSTDRVVITVLSNHHQHFPNVLHDSCVDVSQNADYRSTLDATSHLPSSWKARPVDLLPVPTISDGGYEGSGVELEQLASKRRSRQLANEQGGEHLEWLWKEYWWMEGLS